MSFFFVTFSMSYFPFLSSLLCLSPSHPLSPLLPCAPPPRPPLLHCQWFFIALVGAVLCIVSLMQWLMSGAGNLGEWEAGWWQSSPLCLWHVSAQCRCAALGASFGCGHCWGCSLRSLSQPSFPFQSQPHECKNSGRKLITLRRGKSGHKGEGMQRQRDEEEGKEENARAGAFSSFLFLQKCPLFYSPLSFNSISQWMALQTMPYPEWHKFISVAAP